MEMETVAPETRFWLHPFIRLMELTVRGKSQIDYVAILHA